MAEAVVIRLPGVRTCLDCTAFDVLPNDVGWCRDWAEEVVDDTQANVCPKFERL